jgi:hypothetical protein
MARTYGNDPGNTRSLTGTRPAASAAEAMDRLSGFLNGTHTGVHAGVRGKSLSPHVVVEAVRSSHGARACGAGRTIVLGGNSWEPTKPDERRLRDALREALTSEGIYDLVVFGSLARGSTTGFSDVDALLIVSDDQVIEVRRLRRLRRHVFAAGRAVLEYQPMQHHGFLVTTPGLLAHPASLGLPPDALETTVSLFGTSRDVMVLGSDPKERFRAHAFTLGAVSALPRDASSLHRLVAEFELLPALYLQATGRPCPKHASFEIAEAEFGEAWAPYDTLERVRLVWPRRWEPSAASLARIVRNPWTATALRRRLRAPAPRAVARLLDRNCLGQLQHLLKLMNERVP